MDSTNIPQGTLATVLLTAHFWGKAVDFISTTATLVAMVTGAIIGLVTVYRMVRTEWRHHHRKGN